MFMADKLVVQVIELMNKIGMTQAASRVAWLALGAPKSMDGVVAFL